MDELGDRMAHKRQKEMSLTYEGYVKRYRKEGVAIMLEEDDYKNGQEILNVVRVIPSRKQILSGNVDRQVSKKRRSVKRTWCSKL